MENSKVSKSWVLFGLSTIGMVVFAALYVSAKFSCQDAQSLALRNYFQTAKANVKPNGNDLFKLKDVKVICFLSDDIKEVVAENEVKAKFELVLRTNNVPIADNSEHYIIIKMAGSLSKANVLSYATSFNLNEWQPIFRQGECRYAWICSWEQLGKVGFIEKTEAKDNLLEQVETVANIFSKDYLSANPKAQ